MKKKIKYSRLYYPGYIGLDLKTPFVIYGENKKPIGTVTLIDHKIATEIVDLNTKVTNHKPGYSYSIPMSKNSTGVLIDFNQLQKFNFDFDKHLPNQNLEELMVIIEHLPLPRTINKKYFTELLIAINYKESENIESISTEEQILEHFIGKYRKLTSDINVKLPSSFHWNIFGVVPSSIKEIEIGNDAIHQFHIKDKLDFSGFTTKQVYEDLRKYRKISKPEFDKGEMTDLLNKELSNNTNDNGLMELINKCNEEILIKQNYKVALLEAFIFCETFLKNHIRSIKLKKGIGNDKIKVVDFDHLLNNELPLTISNYDQSWIDSIGDINGVKTKRNKVIHRAETVSRDEAINAIHAIEKFINKLS